MLYFLIIHLLASILFYAPLVGDGVTAYVPVLSNYKPTHTIQVNRPVNYDVKVGAQKIIDAIATSSFQTLDLTAFGKDANPTIISLPLAGVHVTVPARTVESEIRSLYASFDMSLIRGAGAKAYVRHVPAVNATAPVDVAPIPAHPIHHSILSVGQAFGSVTAASYKANASSVTVNVQVAARHPALKSSSTPVHIVTGSDVYTKKPLVHGATTFLPLGQSFGPVSFTSFNANVSHFTVDTAPIQPTLESPLKSRAIHQWAVCRADLNELETCLVDPLSVREFSIIDDGARTTERAGCHLRWPVTIIVVLGILVQTIGVTLLQHSLPLVATTFNCIAGLLSTAQPVELADSNCAPIQLAAEEIVVEFTPSSPAASTDATTFDAITEAEPTIASNVETGVPPAVETTASSLPPPSTKSVAELSTIAMIKRNPATACAPYVKSGRPSKSKKTTKARTVKQGASTTRRALRAAQGLNDCRILLIHATDSLDHPIITVVVPSVRWADRLTRLQQSEFVETTFQLLALADTSSAPIQPAADDEVVSDPTPAPSELSTNATTSDQSLDAIDEVLEATISPDVEIDLPLVAETVAELASTEEVAPASAIDPPASALEVSLAPVPSTSDQSSDAVNEATEATIRSDVEIKLPLVTETVAEPASAIHLPTSDVSSAPVPGTSDQSSDVINEATISSEVEIDLPLVAEAVSEPTSTKVVAPAAAIDPLALDVSSAPVTSTSSSAPAGRTRPVIISGARNLLQRTVQAAQSSNSKQQTTGARPRAEFKIKGAAARLAAANAAPASMPKAPRLSFFHTTMKAVLAQDGLTMPSRKGGPSGGPSASA